MQVRLTEGAFARAQRRGLETLLGLDPARLLSPFRREAGLDYEEPYPGWDATGLDGHTTGHVLSALAHHVASGAGPRAHGALRTLIAGLAECQADDGYLGGVPNGRALWDEILGGRIEASRFDLNGRWVPLYNLHKTLAGLTDAVTLTGLGRDVLEPLVEWWRGILAQLDDDALEQILFTEFGGMTEAFARAAIALNDASLIDNAYRFRHRELFDPLAVGRDELAGLHANTQIPVAIGYATILVASRRLGVPEPDGLLDAALTFWKAVQSRTTAIGGNSVSEHWDPEFGSMFTNREGPESCNTLNMVKLAGDLYELTGEGEYLDLVERATTNHLLSAQHPEHGGFVYFTSHRPGHYRNYSPEHAGFWCCVGSGLEVPGRYASLVARAGEIHLLADAAIFTDALEVTVQSGYPDGRCVEVTVEEASRASESWILRSAQDDGKSSAQVDKSAPIAVRIPTWSTGPTVTVDGETVPVEPGGYLHLGAGQSATIDLPSTPTIERAPDGSDWGWIVDGPQVLARRIPDDSLEYVASATRTAHIANGPLRPLADAPILGEIPSDLEPFASIHDARYILSWPLETPTRLAELEAIDTASLTLEARTVDTITFGEQQPESDHNVRGGDMGVTDGVRWRRPGPIDLELRDWVGIGQALQLDWLAEESDATLELTINGNTQHLTLPAGRTSLEVPYTRAADADVKLQVGIVASGTAPRLAALRLLS